MGPGKGGNRDTSAVRIWRRRNTAQTCENEVASSGKLGGLCAKEEKFERCKSREKAESEILQRTKNVRSRGPEW